jgi:hypothetical protein
MREKLRGALDALVAARQGIWLQEPAELGSLLTKKGARNQGATTLIRATRRLAELSTTMHGLRTVARQGGVDLPTMKKVTAPVLEFYADYFGGEYYGMRDFPRTLRQAKDGLAETETLQEYVELVSELTLYTSRMDLWVFDVMIPWTKFGEVFDEIAAQRLAEKSSR